MSWYTSDRRSRLPKDWPHRCQAVKARAHGLCQATVHHPRCDGMGTECDHITPGDDHSYENLQWLNHYCHQSKTQAEAATNNRERAAMRRRPAEEHPGRIAQHEQAPQISNAANP